MKAPETGPSRAMVLLLACSSGAVVGNLYYAQPLVGVIGPDLGLSPRAASLIVSLTQLGYAVGLLLLVPLGDLLENRRLMVVTLLTAAPALLLAGLARTGGEILAAAALIGLTSVSVQMIVPLAAHMTPETRRGQVVGNVMSGLLMGILLARPISSGLAAMAGWRLVFFLSAGLMLGLAALLHAKLPRRVPPTTTTYGALLASLLVLPARLPILRQRAAYQAACFAGFSLFWTGAPLLLLHRFGFTQTGIALFGLGGAAGAFAAPIAGHLGDRGYARPGTVAALGGITLAFGIAALGGVWHSVTLLVLAAILLDAGVQTSLVLGQRLIYSQAPEIRSRLTGLFIALFFLGGAAGSAVTGTLLQTGGWSALCALGAVLPLAALGYFAVAR